MTTKDLTPTSNSQPVDLKTTDVTWDLSCFYSGILDPQIDLDLARLEAMFKDFSENYKGQVAEKLSASILAYEQITMLNNKIEIALFLEQSLDESDAAIRAKTAEVERRLSKAAGQHLQFYALEIVAIDQAVLDTLYQTDDTVRKYQSWLQQERLFKPHFLSEEVESALTKRGAFDVSAWSNFYGELEAALRFDYQGDQKNLTEMLNLLSHGTDKQERAKAMRVINAGLSDYYFAKYAAQTLYMIIGKQSVEAEERGYQHPLDMRNKINNIDDAVVEALHEAVTESAAPLAQEYYRLKAKMLGQANLAWSDRNAPLPFSDTTLIPFDEALKMVLNAYQEFSPTMAQIANELAKERKIDAPATGVKASGAYNCSAVVPGQQVQSFVFLNYLGSSDDVTTLAHELGHAVHGVLAGRAQGPLMSQPPITYCETASIFGEMLTFNSLKQRLTQDGKPEQLLALLCNQLEGIINTVVRQIGFSNFEKRLHGASEDYQTWQNPKKLSAEEISQLWIKNLQEFYGPEGEVFSYENTEYLWSYVSHFHRPFYVYGYAFGELLTHSLYAQRNALGSNFEALYLELLSSGATKNATELLSPFGLDPSSKTFWQQGIKIAIGDTLEAIKKIYQEIEDSQIHAS
jgi:oligoendopeptidase F